MKLRYSKRISGILFWAWLVFILIMTLIPKLPVDTDSDKSLFLGLIRLDYLVHFGVFGILGFFLGIWQLEKIKRKKSISFIFLFGLLFAYFDEFLQIFIEGRKYNIFDFYFNAIGFIMGLVFIIILNKKAIFSKF
jgi:VanZ family protein